MWSRWFLVSGKYHVLLSRSTNPSLEPELSAAARNSATDSAESAQAAPRSSPTRAPVARMSHTPAMNLGGRPEPGSSFAIWRISGAVNTRSLDRRAADVAPACRVQRIAWHEITHQRDAEHLLQIGQKDICGTQIPFGLDDIEQTDQVGARHILYGVSTEAREDAALELAARERPPIFAADAAAIRQHPRLQVDGCPPLEQCAQRDPALSGKRRLALRFALSVGKPPASYARVHAIRSRGPQALRLGARFGESLVRVATLRVIGRCHCSALVDGSVRRRLHSRAELRRRRCKPPLS